MSKDNDIAKPELLKNLVVIIFLVFVIYRPIVYLYINDFISYVCGLCLVFFIYLIGIIAVMECDDIGGVYF